ncbi:MBL fold metallo-hydrolase [Paenibacillus sp. S-38]|uniref:MBL fold metallo-hydrolase n=1 Tax=Paenibacillus sp. S-38 TaxID=3416710 RepID=UPI003CEB3D3A
MTQGYYSVHPIDDGIYHLFEPAGVGCTLVTGTEQALLLDTGYGFGNLADTVRGLTDLPVILVNSHGHVDHIGGNLPFGRAYLHEADMDLARLHGSQTMRRHILGAVDASHLPDGFSREAYAGRTPHGWSPVREGHRFSLGGRELAVYHTPGHTPGCISLLDSKTGTLLSADTVMPMVWLFLPESTGLSTYTASLEKLRKLPAGKIVSSHVPHALPVSCIDRLIECASRIDISKSVPYSTPLAAGEAYLYTDREGDMEVSIAFDPHKLGTPA